MIIEWNLDMTEEEKAKELVDKYHNEFGFDTDTCKMCALIAVDEVLKSYTKEFESQYRNQYIRVEVKKYWIKVKDEITAI